MTTLLLIVWALSCTLMALFSWNPAIPLDLDDWMVAAVNISFFSTLGVVLFLVAHKYLKS